MAKQGTEKLLRSQPKDQDSQVYKNKNELIIILQINKNFEVFLQFG